MGRGEEHVFIGQESRRNHLGDAFGLEYQPSMFLA